MNNRRILVVDDEPDILLVLKQRLMQAGFSVLVAATGPEALEVARKEVPDLIILDLMLPGIDGYQICGILKHDRRYMKIPIIILTARSQKKDYELGISVGADAYLTKPFDSEVLLAKVYELLGEKAPVPKED
jgi:two-component system alkaline phosphatase synthesis response regulator PhoP|uniref:Response regulator n=1 Tax=candidate division WOR-3 bacterium TaxID=2052148 RepID=A0A7C6EAP3_UNCW3